jgi:hypothetical protein
MINSIQEVLPRTRVVLLAAACYAFAGLIVALPLWESLKASSIVQLPSADQKLWTPGGLVMVEWLRLEGKQIALALNVSAWLLVLCGVALLFPVALLYWGLSQGPRTDYTSLARKSLLSLPPFALLWGITLLARASLLTLLVLLWQLALSNIGAPAKPWLTLSALGLGVLCWSLPSLLQDLARAWVVARGAVAFSAIRLAFRSFLTRPLPTLAAYTGPNLAALGVVLLSLRLTKLHASPPGSYVLLLMLVGYNTSLFFVLLLRALWYQRALGIALSSSPPAPVDTRASSGEPDDPSPSRDA